MAFSRKQRPVSMSVLQSCAGVNLPKEKVGLGDAYGANLTKELYNKPELSDVVLRVGKNDYHVHKFLLAHFSDVMKTMLMETRWGDAQKHIVELTETDEAAAVFDSFLRFMYCGLIEANINTAIPILALADKYNVKSLKSVCSDYMEMEIFHSCNVRAALLWWQRANSYNSVSFDSDCFDLIVLSLDEAIATPEWQYLDLDQMCAILETSESIVSGEYSLYEAVEKWLQSTDQSENLHERVERVLPLIRFPSMTPEEIKKVEQSSFYEQFKIKFMPHLYEAFKQLALKDHHRGRGEGSKFHLLKMPRCYTGPPGDQFKSQSSYAQGAISFESFSTIVELSKKSLFNVVTSSCKVLYRHCPKNASMNEFDFATEPEGKLAKMTLYIGTIQFEKATQTTPVPQRQSSANRKFSGQKHRRNFNNLVLIFENVQKLRFTTYRIRLDIYKTPDKGEMSYKYHAYSEGRKGPAPVATLRGSGRIANPNRKPHICIRGDMFTRGNPITNSHENVVSNVERFFHGEVDEQVGRMPHPDGTTQIHAAFVNVDLPEQFKLQTCIIVNDD